MPKILPEAFRVVEVEVIDGKVSKWVVRIELDAKRDLVLVTLPDGFVKTVWTNDANEHHATLNRRRYTHPSAFKG